jgi:FdhE protein
MVTPDTTLLLLLRQERAERPDLARTLDLHIALITARAEVAPAVSPECLEQARARIARGQTALALDHLDVDWESVARLAETVCRIAASYEPEHADAFARIASRLSLKAEDQDAMRGLAAQCLADQCAKRDPDSDHELLAFALNQALHPFLQAYAAAAAPLLKEFRWDRGHCPVCGGSPDFAALEGEVGERRLLCALCDAEWQHRRVGCPSCGNENSRSLGYFPTDKGPYRLYVCEQCRDYLKTVDLRETWLRRPLPVERILTVGLDVSATQLGYGRR